MEIGTDLEASGDADEPEGLTMAAFIEIIQEDAMAQRRLAANVHDKEEKGFEPIEQRAAALGQTARQLRASAAGAGPLVAWGDDNLESLALREKQALAPEPTSPLSA